MNNKRLAEIHAAMNAQFDRWRGWLRFGMHFFGYGAVPVAISGVAYQFGVSENWFVFGRMYWIIGGVLFIYVYELQDYIRKKNGIGKGYLDFVSKALGWTLGVLSWGGWWV